MTVRAFAHAATLVFGLLLVQAAAPANARGQVQPAEVIRVARGTSTLITPPTRIQRVSIGDPEIADAVVVSPRELLVNAQQLGTTTLIVWDADENRRFYTIEVTVDAAALERQLQQLFPDQAIRVIASGNTVILSGVVTDPTVGRRLLEIARASTGATVIDNLSLPPAKQVLLQVRFAEVTRTASQRLGTDFTAGETAVPLGPGQIINEGNSVQSELAAGLLRLFLFEDNVQFQAIVRALRENGLFRSLAEPNLLAADGAEASFLAGGEFPYPEPQAGEGGGEGRITIQFKEFGVRLKFIPQITNAGTIRLAVAPEVSALDFGNGLQLSGFRIPGLLTRRAETVIELRDGQTFAIAGLLDNTLQRSASRVPFLGDIPILGALFRSKDVQQNRTELLVLVTPRIVSPADSPPPPPTGEPETWEWDRQLRRPGGGSR